MKEETKEEMKEERYGETPEESGGRPVTSAISGVVLCRTSRWYVVTVIGQQAGHLALGIGKAAASTLTIIPEQFRGTLVTCSADTCPRVSLFAFPSSFVRFMELAP